MNGLESFIPIILIFVIMYFLLIRPQQKKIKEHKNMVDNLRRGDQVLTQGGIIGKITNISIIGIKLSNPFIIYLPVFPTF